MKKTLLNNCHRPINVANNVRERERQNYVKKISSGVDIGAGMTVIIENSPPLNFGALAIERGRDENKYLLVIKNLFSSKHIKSNSNKSGRQNHRSRIHMSTAIIRALWHSFASVEQYHKVIDVHLSEVDFNRNFNRCTHLWELLELFSQGSHRLSINFFTLTRYARLNQESERENNC